jgi:hypothetical protein
MERPESQAIEVSFEPLRHGLERFAAATILFSGVFLGFAGEAGAQRDPCLLIDGITGEVIGRRDPCGTPPTTPVPDEKPAPTQAPPRVTTPNTPPKSPSVTSPRNTTPTTAKPKKAEAAVAPTTTENPDKDGDGKNDQVQAQEKFIQDAISKLASEAEAAYGYPFYNTSTITPDMIGQIQRGEITVEQVLAAHQNPAPTTTTQETTTTLADASTTTVALLPETPNNNSGGQLAVVETTTEVIVPDENNSPTLEIVGGTITFVGLVIAGAALLKRIRLRGRGRNGRNKGHGLGGDGMRPAF